MEAADKANFKDKLRGKISYLINTLANYIVDGQTVITQRMVDLLQIPSEKVWGIWPSGVNLAQFSKAQEKRVWPGGHDPVILIYIGTLNYERNLMTLCQAVVNANLSEMKFNLLLYGEGSQKKELESFANQTDGLIKICATVSHDQVPDILASAHVGVLPFPDEEKFRVSSPIKLFEYMGSGMPILATEIVCHTDVIGKGEYAFWAKNANINGIQTALKEIWSKRTLLSEMGDEAAKASLEWTYEVSAMKLNIALLRGITFRR